MKLFNYAAGIVQLEKFWKMWWANFLLIVIVCSCSFTFSFLVMQLYLNSAKSPVLSTLWPPSIKPHLEVVWVAKDYILQWTLKNILDSIKDSLNQLRRLKNTWTYTQYTLLRDKGKNQLLFISSSVICQPLCISGRGSKVKAKGSFPSTARW